jgi:hypothetical protein
MDFGVKFENEVSITVLDGKTGEVAYQYNNHNAISDDILGTYAHIFYTTFASSSTAPYCFILPDGTQWSGFTYDRSNPWAPYCITANNSIDTGAQPQWQARTGVGGYTAPTNTVTGRHKLFFQWNNLPLDFTLRAIGLTGWQSENTSSGDIGDYAFGAGSTLNQQPTVFVPQTLLVLPSGVLVHGRNGGGGTPDILQVSYFLSIVGTS